MVFSETRTFFRTHLMEKPCMGAQSMKWGQTKPLALLFAACALVAPISGCGGGRVHRWEPPIHCESSAIVDTARSQLGKPYLTGGASPEEGFDCSGFTCWVFSRCGVTLPRRSCAQYSFGERIPWERIRAGDLLFFETSEKGASHVGIYTGCGTFLHCPHPGATVREDRLSALYWQRRYVGACRVLP